MNPEEQEVYEAEHSDRFQRYIKAGAVAEGTWHMAIELGNPGSAQQDRYFEVKSRLERLYGETNGWTPGHLTDYQRLFISERIANEAVRFLAASVLAASHELSDHTRFKAWMDAHAQVDAEISSGGKLPRYERTPRERSRNLTMVIENAADEFDFLRRRAEQDAGCLDDEQRDGLRDKLRETIGWITELTALLDGSSGSRR